MSKLLRLPGLIDIHVHLRDPGETHKEDFYTGTCAAVAGGITTVFDMPNNVEPILSLDKLIEKIKIAKQKAVCDFGLYFGSIGDNEFIKIADLAVGLKLYLSVTTGKYVIGDEDLLEKIFLKWPKQKVIIVHAEGDRVDLVIKLTTKYQNKMHITHVSTKDSLEKIIDAKKNNHKITCDTAPHYLFLSKEQTNGKDTSGVIEDVKTPGRWPDGLSCKELLPGGGINKKGFYSVKPPLATKIDQEFLWENLKYIDCIATDHAPHTIEEKKSDNPPTGMPGLETMLPLLLTAVKQGRLTVREIIRLTNTNPQKIFGIKQDENTYVEVDTEEKYTIRDEDLKTKCGWSPFNGWEVQGKVKAVYLRGIKVFENGKILVSPGFGKKVYS